MPYSNKDSLPEAVKKLSPHLQDMWMTVFNKVYGENKDEKKAFAIAWGAVNKAMMKSAREAFTGVLKLQCSGKDATGYKWDVRILQEGLDLNNRIWSGDVLKSAIPIFEGTQVFIVSEAQHQESAGRFGKSVDDFIGWIKNVYYIEGQGLYGTLVITPNIKGENLRKSLLCTFKEGYPDCLGLSADVLGEGVNDASGFKVKKIKSATVDVVYEPAAGGQFLRMASAKGDNMPPESEKKEQDDSKKELEELKAGLLAEAEKMRILSSSLMQERMLLESKLPIPVQEKLKKTFEGKSVDEGTFKSAITLEKDTLDKVMGEHFKSTSHLKMGEDDRDKRIKMLDDFFDEKVHSFKACYQQITGDMDVTGLKKDCVRLTSSIDTTTFSYILGDSIRRRMLAEYGVSAYNQDWMNICNIVPVSDFRTNRRQRIGGYGNLPEVAENDPYTALTTPGEEEATYALSKKGGTETVTWEATKNDDAGVIRGIPRRLSNSAARTLYEFVFDFIATNPTIYDGIALFHSSHSNIGSNAFDATYFSASRLRMLKQTELSSGKRIGIPPKWVLCPVDLQKTVYDIISAPRNSDFNPTTAEFNRTLSMGMITIPYWTDTNNWYLAASPMDVPGLEIAFLDGKREPELFVQDQETVGSVFTHDRIIFKIRHIYKGAITDYRAFDGSIVA